MLRQCDALSLLDSEISRKSRRTNHNPPSISPAPDTQGHNTTTFHVPPLDGSIPFPELHDWHFHNSPDHPVFVFPFPDPSDPNNCRTICWKELIPAIHRAGRVVSSIFNFDVPVPSENPPVIAILAASDTFTYCTMNLGIMRTGAILFALSPRNSPQAIAHLLQETRTSYLLVGRQKGLHAAASESLDFIRAANGSIPKLGEMPLFEDLFLPAGNEVESLPPLKSTDVGRIGLIIHSSGSTAFPKPISWSWHNLLLMGRFPYFGEQDLGGLRASFHAIPFFHGLSMIAAIWSASCGMTITSFAPQSNVVPPNATTVFDGCIATKSDIVFSVPIFIESWAREPEKVETMKKMTAVYYGGAILSKEVGDILCRQGIHVMPIYASSETSLISRISNKVNGDWEYFQISPHVRSHFIPDGNDTFQLVIFPHEDHCPAVLNTKVGGQDAYATNDLLVPHPTREGYWRVYGRADDQIIHSTGEKTNPVPLESIMNQDPHVMSSVLFGSGRFSPGLLVEPQHAFRFDPHDIDRLAEFRSLIWPSIVKMNEYAPQHSRIFKEMILVASPSKPFGYTAKGTARRDAIINDYKNEIRELYLSLQDVTKNGIASPSVWTLSSTLDYVRDVINGVMTWPVEDDDDFFQWGCDSLQATWIRKTIFHSLRGIVKVHIKDFPSTFVYEHSSIKSLAQYTFDLIYPDKVALPPELNKVDEMLSMVRKYSFDFPIHPPLATVVTVEYVTGDVVLITGTTGAIGASVLSELVGSSNVTRVYAINRKQSRPLLQRQTEALVNQGLDPSILESGKVVLVEGDLCKSDLGLPKSILDQVHATVTHIMHVAWRVDFNLSLQSFQRNVHGLRNIIDLALSSSLPSPPRLLFTSTVSLLKNYTGRGPAPEHPVEPEHAINVGYSESKWVAETLLLTAATKTALRPIIVRVGQVSGHGITGSWKGTEWFPSIIQSAVHVKCLPSSTRDFSLVPLDFAARVLVEMRNSPREILHLANPSPVSWNTIVTPIADMLRVPLVTYKEWLSRLEILDFDNRQDENPTLRLLGFFRSAQWDSPSLDCGNNNVMGMPTMSIEEAWKISPSIKQIRPVTDDVKKWLTYWKVPILT